MVEYLSRVTIIRVRKPINRDINTDIEWLSKSLGLFNLRDKEKSCYRLFIELLKAAKNKYMISSDELAARCNLTRGTVIHHLNKLMETGIVVKEGRRYMLRVANLEALIREIRRDIDRSFEDLKEIAGEIDSTLELSDKENMY